MRPMALMPTPMIRLSLLRARCRRGQPNFVQPGLQRHPLELLEGQVNENRNPAVEAGIKLIEQAARSTACGELGRVRQRLHAGHHLVAEIRAGQAVLRVAKGDQEVHPRRIRTRKHIPRLAMPPDTSWPSARSLSITSGIGRLAGSEPAE